MVQMIQERVIGQPLSRIDGPKKVTGTSAYAFEHSPEGVTYGFAVQSTIAKGHISSIDVSKAQAIEGVLTILTHENAPRLQPQSDAELNVLQSNAVAYRGQFIAFVVAQTLEIARQAAEAVVVQYAEQPHDVVLSADRNDLYKPDKVNPFYDADTQQGDVEAALALAPIVVDQTYTTPAYHNNPMEPHATIAHWDGESVTLYHSTQGAHFTQMQVAQVFGLKPEQVRVIAPYVGGGFGFLD
jgi:xanthine dehydrogenase YagR molybdenum-binding subunit